MSLLSLFLDRGSDHDLSTRIGMWLGMELRSGIDSFLQKHPRAVVYGILGVLVIVPTLMVGSLLLSGPPIKPATLVTAGARTPAAPAPTPARPAAPADLVISAPPAGTRLPPLPTWTGSSGRAPLTLGVDDARRVVQSHATHVQKRGESDLEYWTVRQMQANNPNLKAEAEPGNH
ncbi:MAG: hypothetical protein GX442_10540 [Candidatus Riflebacteria bacterium]|nr:hypothetical protein [Candidatus Riflebacteria bacterium]